MRQIIVDFGVLHLFGMQVPLRIYGYGLMMVLGFLFGIGLAQWRARRSGVGTEVIPIMGILALVGGVLGAYFGLRSVFLLTTCMFVIVAVWARTQPRLSALTPGDAG